ncbi:MAG: ATP-binding protein [Verrucomicrobiota bacterium]|jgi:hypothetical protein
MLNEEQLREWLRSSETHWVERKKSFDRSEVTEAIVAFANSVPENQHAVLFIGIAPDGSPAGVPNADMVQRKINSIAGDCFPSIRCTPAIVREGGKEIVAVVMEFSKERPHFAGAPFVRVGSETIKDRQKLRVLLEDLIASRNDKARWILRDKGKLVSTVWRERENAASNYSRTNAPTTSHLLAILSSIGEKKECRVEGCDAHCVHLFEVVTGKHVSASLENVKIDYDHEKSRTKLIIHD